MHPVAPGKRILIVDDDPDIHNLLCIALAEEGRSFESAFNGIEALDKIETSHWDLVITDVIMPGMDGLELLERLHRSRPEVPVVVMTVETTADKIVTAIRDRAFSWLRKPFSKRAVIDLVAAALAAPRLENDIYTISATPRWLELRIRCDLRIASRALDFLKEMEHDMPEAERENVALAFREILFNAIEHGGDSNPDVYVTVTYTRANGAVLFRVKDPGPGFSFQNLRHAAISNPPDSPVGHLLSRAEQGMRPGGFGILLTRALVDELIYNEHGNEALLIRYVRNASVTAA